MISYPYQQKSNDDQRVDINLANIDKHMLIIINHITHRSKQQNILKKMNQLCDYHRNVQFTSCDDVLKCWKICIDIIQQASSSVLKVHIEFFLLYDRLPSHTKTNMQTSDLFYSIFKKLSVFIDTYDNIMNIYNNIYYNNLSKYIENLSYVLEFISCSISLQLLRKQLGRKIPKIDVLIKQSQPLDKAIQIIDQTINYQSKNTIRTNSMYSNIQTLKKTKEKLRQFGSLVHEIKAVDCLPKPHQNNINHDKNNINQEKNNINHNKNNINQKKNNINHDKNNINQEKIVFDEENVAELIDAQIQLKTFTKSFNQLIYSTTINQNKDNINQEIIVFDNENTIEPIDFFSEFEIFKIV